MRYRTQLENSLKHRLGQDIITLAGRNLFNVNQPVSYSEFIEEVYSYNPDAILLIDQKSYSTRQVISGTSGNVQSRQEPSATFNTYLFAIDHENPMTIQWMANVHVRGRFAGYDTINNNLSKNVVNRLKRSGYLL